MRKTIVIIVLGCAIAQSQSLRMESGGSEGFFDQTKQQAQNPDIDKTSALNIAKQHAEQTYGSVEAYSTVVCEQPLLWRVFFDPKNATSGLAYFVSKRGGMILGHRKLPLGEQNNEETPATSEIDRNEAIAIAKKDAKNAYGSLVRYQVIVCELRKAWIVIYSLNPVFDGGGPEYEINKGTGDILDKKYYQ